MNVPALSPLYAHLAEREVPESSRCVAETFDQRQDETWILGQCLCGACVRFRDERNAAQLKLLRLVGALP